MKKLLRIVLLLALALACSHAAAQEISVPLTGGSVNVRIAEIQGRKWLFLPAFANLRQLFPDAVPAQEEGVWLDEGRELYVMQSQNLRALFLFSDDPKRAGRAFVEDCERHENEATGSMAIVNPDGCVEHADKLRQLRGRGNGTWEHDKRPYQFKLENRADLLKTGNASEKSRTWVLLAEATDGTFLHNRIALDLGLELGMEHTSRSEFVDLYYDGEYRGVYLLAEKVEIDEARIDEFDFEKLINRWNRRIGISELDALPVQQGINEFGNEFYYIEGAEDNGNVNAGAYLLEMESTLFGPTFSERCYFRLNDQSIISVKNPENASESMVRYISERLTEARETLDNGGVHPLNGRIITDDFDVDGFARLALIAELSNNLDAFSYSSTYFVLPAGEERFEAGPAWDYDLAWRYGSKADTVKELKGTSGWLEAFYRSPVFVARMTRLYRDELGQLIQEVLLGERSGRFLRPLESYAQEIRPACLMNNRLWETKRDSRLAYGDTFDEEIELLRRYIAERHAWLNRALVENDDLGADGIELSIDVEWTRPEDGVQAALIPGLEVRLVSLTSEQISEATEEDYAVYQVDMVFAPADGLMFETPRVMINDQRVASRIQEDGTLLVRFGFEDRSYRPVDYYGDDVGMIYDYDAYVQNHPEVLEICGQDSDAVLEYFFDEGIYLGHKGNHFFDPAQVLLYHPSLQETYGEDWQNYYWDFIYFGCDEGWLRPIGETYRPELVDLLE